MHSNKRTLQHDSNVSDENEWIKCFSKTYNCDYWFNAVDGTKSWTEPNTDSGTTKKQKTEEEIVKNNSNNKVSVESVSKDSMENSVKPKLQLNKVAIIVPFRDITTDKTRTKQLNRFVPHMVSYLSSTDSDFHVYIIEQSNDKRKFNRGKLLNIGFSIALREGCNTFIFHDVDLLPSEDLKKYYITQPQQNPIHIARVWDRYNANPNYFGGVVNFSADMYQRINGFPNNFWGEFCLTTFSFLL